MVTGRHGDEKTQLGRYVFVRNGERDRRSDYERRRFRYDAHIPERRKWIDRRNGTVQESLNNVAIGR